MYPFDKAVLPCIELDDLDGPQHLTDELNAMIGRVGNSYTKTLFTTMTKEELHQKEGGRKTDRKILGDER